MGCKKLSVDVKKRVLSVKLHPSMIQLLHDVAKERNVKVVRVVEECLAVLKTESI